MYSEQEFHEWTKTCAVFVDGPDPNGDVGVQGKTSSRSILIYGGFTGEVVEGDVLEMDIGGHT